MTPSAWQSILQVALLADRRLGRRRHRELARLDPAHRLVEVPAGLLDRAGS